VNHGGSEEAGEIFSAVDSCVYTVVFHCDDGSTDHDEWIETADIYHEDTDGSIMQYDYCFRGAPSDPYYNETWPFEHYARKEIFPCYLQGWPVHTTYATYGMVRFDLDLLPKDVEILSAKLHVTADVTQSAATYNGGGVLYRNGLHAVFDTLYADTGWATGGTECNSCGDPRYRDVSWNYYDTSATMAWNPSLDDRVSTWHWGVKSHNNYWVLAGGEEDLSFDVKEAVQQYVCADDMANAGWWFFPEDATGSAGFRPIWGPHSEAHNKQPWLVVTYRNTAYKQRWNGYPLAFVFTTDDNHDENMAWYDVAAAKGVSMSACVFLNVLDQPGSMTTAELVAYNNLGLGLSLHSREHGSPDGVLSYATNTEMAYECERSWLEEITGDNHKTFAFPNHARNARTDSILATKGYLGARGGKNRQFATRNLGEPVQLLRWYTPKGTSMPVNLMGIGMTGYMDEFVGDNATDITKDGIRANLQPIIAAAADSGYAAIITYAHTTKTGGTDRGIDVDEWGWLVECLQEHGGIWITDFEQLLEQYRAHHSPSDLPTSVNGSDYYHSSRVEFGLTAADSIYWDTPPETPEVSVDEAGDNLPWRGVLGVAYPNPFNPQTTIRYDLSTRTIVTLSIFDLAGRLVDVLVEGETMSAGIHTATWNGRDSQGRATPSGTYFYRLEARGYVETRRMTLIR